MKRIILLLSLLTSALGLAQSFSMDWYKIGGGGGTSADGTHQLTVTAVTSDNGYPAHEVRWTDSAGLPRTAIMVDQNSTTAPYTGYLRQYAYQVNGQTRVCTGTDNYATGGNLEFSGDGFVQNHTAASAIYPVGGDFSSGNGGGVPGTTTITLQGTDHALITYYMPDYQIVDQAGNTQTVPTAVQWFFANGRSHPVFAFSQDARATAGNIAADSRSPYGDMAYDGDGADAFVGGCSYGDSYKFVTLAANPEEVTAASGWRDTEANAIPYAMQWAEPATVDAEMGHVATVPISVCDQGEDAQEYPPIDPRGASQPNGPMLTDESWAFQILNESFPASGPTTTKRLAWGANYGRVGGWDDSSPGYTDPRYPDSLSGSLTQYNKHYDDPLGKIESGSRADGLLMAYSVFVVFGTHTGGYANGTVGQQVIQMENATRASLSAAIGAVETSGPAGVGNASSATIAYTPAGYNPTYSSWEIAAATNAVDATLTPAANYPLDHPLFVINGYASSQLPAIIAVGAGLTNAGIDYFATVDTAGQRLWITVNRLVASPLNLVVNGSGSGMPPSGPVISSIPSSGTVGTAIVIIGENFTGATGVAFNGVAASFTVNSPTQISATVPAGATSGPIAVTTPGGTAQSAASFTVVAAPANLPIYVDSLLNGFQDYSWATDVDYQNASPVYAGSYSISVTAAPYTALWLYHEDFNTSPYSSLSFWLNGGAAGAQGLQVMGVVTQAYQAIYSLPALAANTWTRFSIPLSALGVANVTDCQGFWFWPTLSGTTVFYLDSIQLNHASAAAPTLAVVRAAPDPGSFVFQLSGIPGQTYWIQTSTDLATWASISTNVLASSSANITNSVIPASSRQFWRAIWPP
jgi:hypothetical protein